LGQTPRSLLASFFTIAGNVTPFTPPLVSPIPFRSRAEAAGRAGFRGFGFSSDDLKHVLREHDYADVLSILTDNGLVHLELELLRDWFSTGEQREASALEHKFFFGAAEKLRASHIKIGTTGGEYPSEHMIESFATLCDAAAQAGTAIVMEISPFGRIRDLRTGTAIVEGAGRANGGLLLDLWHVTRSRMPFGEIASLPWGVLRHVELDDGTAEQQGGYFEETVNRRRLCGAGEFDIAGFLSAVSATGYDGPYGVEILSDANRLLTVGDAARLAFESARAQFAAY
jgi:sugar phosphate isomerase/epimerase